MERARGVKVLRQLFATAGAGIPLLGGSETQTPGSGTIATKVDPIVATDTTNWNTNWGELMAS